MHNVEHALSVISQALGLPGLGLNHNGQVELVLAEGFSCFVTKLDETQMELSIRLPDLTYATPSMTRALLAANCLGALSGAGRLALDLGREEVIYCERWNVADFEAETVDRKLSAFIAHAAFWLTEGGKAVIAEGDRDLAERRAREEARLADLATPEADEDGDDRLPSFDIGRLGGLIRL